MMKLENTRGLKTVARNGFLQNIAALTTLNGRHGPFKLRSNGSVSVADIQQMCDKMDFILWKSGETLCVIRNGNGVLRAA